MWKSRNSMAPRTAKKTEFLRLRKRYAKRRKKMVEKLKIPIGTQRCFIAGARQ
jgi:hypothetical protein